MAVCSYLSPLAGQTVHMQKQGNAAILLPGTATAHAQCFSARRTVLPSVVTQGRQTGTRIVGRRYFLSIRLYSAPQAGNDDSKQRYTLNTTAVAALLCVCT
jgi:hypothetical protein